MKEKLYNTILNIIESTNDECESILNSTTGSDEKAIRVTDYATAGISNLYKLFDILRGQSIKCDSMSDIAQGYVHNYENGKIAEEISDSEFDNLMTEFNKLVSYQDAIEEIKDELDDILDRLESLFKWFGI